MVKRRAPADVGDELRSRTARIIREKLDPDRPLSRTQALARAFETIGFALLDLGQDLRAAELDELRAKK